MRSLASGVLVFFVACSGSGEKDQGSDTGEGLGPELLEDYGESVIDDLDWEDVQDLSESSPRRALARFVGYYSKIREDQTWSRCTATAVAPTLVLTNEHCLPVDSVVVNFDYLSESDYDTVPDLRDEGFWCTEVVISAPEHDLALLRCPPEENGGQVVGDALGGYVDLPVDGVPSLVSGASLYLLHQNCYYEDQVGCGWVATDAWGEAVKKMSPGLFLQYPLADYSLVDGGDFEGEGGFLHDADTLGGTSGALVFSEQTHTAMGLHHGGSEIGNKARYLGDIFSDIPQLLTEIAADIVEYDTEPCIDNDGDTRGSGCALGEDCDDGNPNVWESCDTCLDADGDGWWVDCDNFETVDGPDCTDEDGTIYPGAPESCDDGIDNNCNEEIDCEDDDCFDHTVCPYFTAVSAGFWHTCGVRADGTLLCWGEDDFGQVSGAPSGSFTDVDAGGNHTCAIRTSGAVSCWGSDDHGESTPLSGNFSQVSAGSFHTCGLKSGTGEVRCWGYDLTGQATPPSGTFTQVSSGENHSCGLKDDYTLACWGYDIYGQSTAPEEGYLYLSVTAGSNHSCAHNTNTYRVDCWGFDERGQASPPSTTFTPAISGAEFHTCGVATDMSVECWGANPEGESTPPEGSFVDVTTGSNHSCALGLDYRVSCWGDDSRGASTVPLP
jgi:hypothetical protein